MKTRRIMLCSLVSLIMVFVMAVPMTVSAAEKTVTDETLQSAINSASDGDVLKLGKDFTESVTIPAEKNITLDLNGHNLNWTNSDPKNKKTTIDVSGGLIVKDSTATKAPVVSNDYKTVNYKAGRICCDINTIRAISGGTFELQSGIVESTGGIAVSALGNIAPGENTPEVNSKVTVSGGYILSQEYGVSPQGNGAEVTVAGGVIVAKDNAAVAGNGTQDSKANRGGTTINITDGVMISHIQSPGYIACGIYHPQEGYLNISGGTIYADNGVGILMRSGALDMTGGTVTATGTASGKVGDSTIIANCYGIQVDSKSDYPGVASIGATISGKATINADAGVDALNTLGEYAEGRIAANGGCYSSDVSAFVPQGKVAIKFKRGTDEKYYVGEEQEIQEIANSAKSGDLIDVIKGSVNLTIKTPGVTVGNNGGEVTVNDQELKNGTALTIPEKTEPTTPSKDPSQKPADNAKADKNVATGDDFNMLAAGGTALAAIIAMAAVVITGRRQRQK